MKRHVHIGYGDSATDCLKEAIEKFALPGEDAIPSRDDFTQGPISDCLTGKGVDQRIAYWETMEKVLRFGKEVGPFYKASIELLNTLRSKEITLWVGDSCHDILATGWLLSFLSAYDTSIYFIDLSRVDKEDWVFGKTAVNLAMYTPEQLPKLWKYRKRMDDAEKNKYLDIFKKACQENSPYRIQIEDDIVSVPGDYFDTYILSFIDGEWKLCSHIIGQILKDGEHGISDTTVEWNIRKMIGKGILEYSGSLEGVKSYSIKRKG